MEVVIVFIFSFICIHPISLFNLEAIFRYGNAPFLENDPPSPYRNDGVTKNEYSHFESLVISLNCKHLHKR